MGSAGGGGEKIREVLSVLFGTVSGHQIQHHHTAKDAVLHGESYTAVRGDLQRHAARVLHPRQLGGENHHGHHHPQLPQHLPAAGGGDQPAHLARHPSHRQISTIHNGARDMFHHSDGVRVKHTLPVALNTRHVAVDTGALSQRASSAAVDAATAKQTG